MFQRRLVASASALLILLASLGLALAQGSPASPYLFDLMAKPPFKSSFEAMFKNEKNVDGWLARYSVDKNGPATPSRTYQTDGKPGIGGWVCETHNCGPNRFFYLFSQDGSRAVGLQLENNAQRWFGNPSPAERKTLLQVVKTDG